MTSPLDRNAVRAAVTGQHGVRPALVPLDQRIVAEVAKVSPERLAEDPGVLAGAVDFAQRLFGYDAIVVGFDPGVSAEVEAEAARRVRSTRVDVAVVGVVPAPAVDEDRPAAIALARELGEAGVDVLLLQHWTAESHNPATLRTLSRIAAHYQAVLVQSVGADDPFDRVGAPGPLAPGRSLSAEEELAAPASVARVLETTESHIRSAAWLTTRADSGPTTPEHLHAAIAALAQ
jgi:hypothetical protein